tara:strand:+ start:5759 stop:6904 length:1146 start_codon:yes stop_codon:yes gene_type:complete
MTFKLTRLLYSYDEVKLSLLCALIKKSSLDECYFWCGELYYSDPDDAFDIFKFIWKIYFDFYAIHNPGLEKYIQKKELNWREKPDIKILLSLIVNFWSCPASPDLFLLRNMTKIHSESLVIYRVKGKKWSWLGDFPACYHNFLIAIEKNHTDNAARILYQLCKNNESNEIYNIIIRYYSTRINLLPDKVITKKRDNRHWRNDFHGLLALMIHLQTPVEDINHLLIFKQPSKKSVEIIENNNNAIEERHRQIDRVYRILKDYRKYSIQEHIGLFHLDRDTVDNYVDECRQHWHCYIAQVPLWRTRINTYNGQFHKKKLVLQNEEEFYNKYDLELDEQSPTVQYKSLAPLKNYTIDKWVADIFGDQFATELDDVCAAMENIYI